MITIFMNSENSKASQPHVLEIKLSDKLDLRRGEKIFLFQALAFTTNRST